MERNDGCWCVCLQADPHARVRQSSAQQTALAEASAPAGCGDYHVADEMPRQAAKDAPGHGQLGAAQLEVVCSDRVVIAAAAEGPPEEQQAQLEPESDSEPEVGTHNSAHVSSLPTQVARGRSTFEAGPGLGPQQQGEGTYSAPTLPSDVQRSRPGDADTDMHVSEIPQEFQPLASSWRTGMQEAECPSVPLLLQLETQDPDAMPYHERGQMASPRPAAIREQAALMDSTRRTCSPKSPNRAYGGSPSEVCPEGAVSPSPEKKGEEDAIWSAVLADTQPSTDAPPARCQAWQPRSTSGRLQPAEEPQEFQAVNRWQRATSNNGLNLRPVWGATRTSGMGTPRNSSGAAAAAGRLPSNGRASAHLLDSPEATPHVQATADVLLLYSRGLPGATSPGSQAVSSSWRDGLDHSAPAAGKVAAGEVSSEPCASIVLDTYPHLCDPSHGKNEPSAEAEAGPPSDADAPQEEAADTRPRKRARTSQEDRPGPDAQEQAEERLKRPAKSAGGRKELTRRGQKERQGLRSAPDTQPGRYATRCANGVCTSRDILAAGVT
jgi:hypothetical protein